MADAPANLMADVLERVGEAFCALDRNLILTCFNRAAEELFSRSRDEAVGRPASDLFAAAGGHLLESAIQRAAGEGAESEFECEAAGRFAQVRVFPLGTGAGILIRDCTAERGLQAALASTGDAGNIAERKETEERLRASEAHLSAIFAQTSAGFTTTDPDGRFTLVNDRYCEIVGRSREELLGKRMHDITHPDDLPMNAEQFRRCTETGEPFEIEKRYVRPDGSAVWVLNAVSLVHDIAGRIDSIVCMTIDITARRAAEQSARDSAAQLRMIADLMPQIVWSAKADGHFDYFNARWLAFTGTAPGETDGEGWMRMLHPDHREHARAAWQHSVATGEPYQTDLLLRAADGSYRWVLARALPLRGQGEELLRWIGTFTDIDDQKRAVEALARSQERFRLAQDGARVGFWDTDLITGKTWWSNSVFRLLGLEPTADGIPLGDPLAAIHPDDRPRCDEASEAAIREGKPLDCEFRVTRTDGAVRWLAARGEVIRDADGRPVRLVGVDLDVTERHQAEERQILLMREVDHRAKNALAVVQSLVRLTPADEPAAYRQAVEGRVAALARAHNLLAGNRWSGADLEQIIVEEVTAYHCESRVRLSGPPLRLSADMAQSVELLIHELATNAVKHGALSQPAGMLKIDWTLLPDRAVELRWAELGGPPVSKPLRSGFGSVLIETTIGHQLGGEAVFDWAQSGLTVMIRLPSNVLAPGSSGRLRPEADTPAPARPDLHGRRVLVVEDNALVALDTQSALSDLGVAVIGPAGTVELAQQLAEDELLDAAVLDVDLHGRDVLPVAEALRRRGIPFVLCTGYGEPAGVGGFAGVPLVMKPYRASDLAAALSGLFVA